MDAHCIYIFYKADGDFLIFSVPNNLKLQFFPSEDGFLDKYLSNRAERKASGNNCSKLLDVVNQAATGSAHGISGANDTGQADIFERFFCFFKAVCNLACCHFDAQLIHRILECLAVFSPLNSVNLNANNLYAVFFQNASAR